MIDAARTLSNIRAYMGASSDQPAVTDAEIGAHMAHYCEALRDGRLSEDHVMVRQMIGWAEGRGLLVRRPG